MANSKEQTDSLGFYLTGAASDGGSQPIPNNSLGTYRSQTELFCLGGLIDAAIPPLIVEQITPACGEGEGTLRGDVNGNVYFTEPGGSEGAAVAIASGERKLVVGSDLDKAIRVYRESSDTILGSMTVDMAEHLNGLVGGPNLTNAERAAGADKYRAAMMRPHGQFGVVDVRLWIATLGTQRVSDSAQLGASGTGTIETTGSFADWPEEGFCQVRTTSGVLREIVYYSERTATVLTISDANHRALLGSSAGAGAGTDTVDAVPGIRLAVETVDSDKKIQTIANEDTAPTGMTWNTSITAAAGLYVTAIDVNANHGLWIHREFPAGGVRLANYHNAINVQFWGAEE